MRQAFKSAADYFLSMVDRIPGDAWARPGLGEWDLRELVGHTNRALLNVEMYSKKPGHLVEVDTPADYFIEAMRRLAGPSVIAQRGREAGAALGDSPAEKVRETARHVLAKVDSLPDTFILGVPVGGMLLNDYLATRVFELTIHTLDIGSAIGVALEPPVEAISATMHLLADLAVKERKASEIALALTGRRSLPEGFTLLD